MDEDRPTADGWAQCPRCGTRYAPGAQYCQRDGAPLVSADEAPDPYLGQVLLDQFRIEEILGSGGMGSVYRARQSSLDRDVAIKILHASLTDQPDAVRRFQREARVATTLDHPNVVRVLLLGQLTDGSPYLVMEYVPGRSLGQLLRQEGPLPLHRALHIVTQVADAVGEAHAHGIVHRDVKPENVMIVRRGSDAEFVKVLDFGIARLLWDEHTVATQSGVIFGTARYISPEGASGEPTDARSDVYSIGVLAYQLIAGVTPFEGTTPVTLLLKHVNDPVPDIRERARCPDPVAEVIMRALRKRPSGRFEDAKAMASALREAAVRCSVRVATPATASEVGLLPAPNGSVAPAASASRAAASPANEPSSVGGAPLRRRPRLGAGATLLLAFALGAGAVTAGGVLVGWLLRGGAPAASEEVAEEPPAQGSVPSEAGAEVAGDGASEQRRDGDGFEAPRAPRESASKREPAPARNEPRRRARRRAAPVTTIHPGRGEGEWSRPILAPAVDRAAEDAGASDETAAEHEAVDGTHEAAATPSDSAERAGGDEGSPGPGEADDAPEDEGATEEPPPPWTGSLL